MTTWKILGTLKWASQMISNGDWTLLKCPTPNRICVVENTNDQRIHSSDSMLRVRMTHIHSYSNRLRRLHHNNSLDSCEWYGLRKKSLMNGKKPSLFHYLERATDQCVKAFGLSVSFALCPNWSQKYCCKGFCLFMNSKSWRIKLISV